MQRQNSLFFLYGATGLPDVLQEKKNNEALDKIISYSMLSVRYFAFERKLLFLGWLAPYLIFRGGGLTYWLCCQWLKE
jgi:hypothetical protein